MATRYKPFTAPDTTPRPKYYHRDGTPITVDPELGISEVLQWAMYFEHDKREVRQSFTPYGERLSTVFLGLDHNWGNGLPLIFETMLFAPDPQKIRRSYVTKMDDESRAAWERFEAAVKKHFPHDQLQLRYSNEQEAIESHIKLRLQCLIPPRWRRLLCYEIGGDETWQ